MEKSSIRSGKPKCWWNGGGTITIRFAPTAHCTGQTGAWLGDVSFPEDDGGMTHADGIPVGKILLGYPLPVDVRPVRGIGVDNLVPQWGLQDSRVFA